MGSRDLLEIINDILDFSKIEAGKLETELVDCSLAKLLNSVESLMRPKAQEKGLEFGVVEGRGLPAIIRTDPVRLRQCLLNLLSNAIKFTEHGHVRTTVSLVQRADEPHVRFDVEDTGLGISPEKYDVIFEAFMQADGGDTRRFGRTGLGLAITKKLAGLLGGELTLTSKVAKGSVFSLVIPAGVDVTSQPFLDRHDIAGRMTTEDSRTEQPRFSGRVLVAEDSPTNQILAKLLLERMGFDVTIAEDGSQAVENALEHHFDLIFMDIQMPNMNGYEATRFLRQNSVTTPIIALTAHAMKGDREKCIAAGCRDYLPKPIDQKKLLQIVQQHLPSHSQTPAPQH